MDNNQHSYQRLFGTLPPEYQMWYTSQLLGFNRPDITGDNSDPNHSDTWNGHLPNHDYPSTSLPVQEYFEQSQFCPNNLNSDQGNSSQFVPPSGIANENFLNWNYVNYLQKPSELETESASFNSVLEDANYRLKEASVQSDQSHFFEYPKEATIGKPTELYSSKLKKGLHNVPASEPEADKTPPTTKRAQSSNGMSQSSVKPDNWKTIRTPLQTSNSSSKKSQQRKSSLTSDSSLFSFFDSEELSSGAKVDNVKRSSCNSCKTCSSTVLNNTFTGTPCHSSNKCPLNVNNNLQRKRSQENLSSENKEQNDKVKKNQESNGGLPEKKVNINVGGMKGRKMKPKSGSFDGGDIHMGHVGEQERNNPVKKKPALQKISKQRSDRGKLPRHSNRKRHAEVEKDKTMDTLVHIFNMISASLSQLPTQPWFKYTVESLTSLIRIILGSLWVFAMIFWEFIEALFSASKVWITMGIQWICLNGSSIIQMIFLYMPGIGLNTTKKTTSSTTPKGEQLPNNGDDAVRRLLHLKGQDPYCILGITPDVTDEDIKKRYKSQAVLVHPDKNHYPGAEEAFKVLASAFEILGNTEKRAEYDQENNIRVDGNEITSFLERIQKNIEEIQSILGCQSCGKCHKRYKTDRQADNARYCSACKTHHAAREGDLWAETTMFGFKWHYYSYLDKSIFDVTEWVTCQPDLMSTVEANSHSVTCRLAAPKGTNRTGAYSRMEDLKDMVNELLTKSRQAGQPVPPSGGSSEANNSKGKQKRHGGATNRRRK